MRIADGSPHRRTQAHSITFDPAAERTRHGLMATILLSCFLLGDAVLRFTATPDRAVALVFFVFFGGLFALSLQLGYWDGFAPASGFAPLWVAVVGAALAIALWFAKTEHDGDIAAEPANEGAAVRVLQAGVGLLAFVAVTPFLGMVPAGALLMLALLIVVLRRPWPASLFTTLVSTALVYGVFVAWLNVPLPKGLLGL